MQVQSKSTSSLWGIAQVMMAAGLWGTVGVSTKLVTSAGTLPQEVLGFARLAVGGLVLLLIVLVAARRSFSTVLSLDPFWLAGFVLGCAVFQVSLFHAFFLLEVTTTVFLTVCLPPLMGSALALLRGENGTSASLVALGIAVVGLATFTIDGFSANIDSQRIHGLALAVLASAAFLLMTSAARRLTLSTSPLVVAGTGLTLAALVLLPVLHVAQSDAGGPAQLVSWQLIGLVLYLGIGPTALAYVLYCAGIARCRSANLGLVASMVEPAFAALLAWAFLHEQLSAQEMLGCTLVMLAMLVLWDGERRLRQSREGPLQVAEI